MILHDDHSCEAVQRLLSAYAHGELGRSERAQVDKHLRRCDVCAQALSVQTRIETQLREGLAASVERHRPSAQVWERLQEQIAPRPRPGLLRMFFATLSTATAGLLATALMLSQFASAGLRDMLRPYQVTIVPESGVQTIILRTGGALTARVMLPMSRVSPAAEGDQGLPDSAGRVDLQVARSLLVWSPISGELNDALSSTKPCASCGKGTVPVKQAKRSRRIVYVVYTFEDRVPKGYCAFYFACVLPA
jgi:anti-sigma factor RsiW